MNAITNSIPNANKRIPREDKLISSPSKGRSLGATVELYSKPIRNAVSYLINNLPSNLSCPQILSNNNTLGCIVENHSTRVAWLIINCSILHSYSNKLKAPKSVVKSIRWFFNESKQELNSILTYLKCENIEKLDKILSDIEINEDFLDLYPYIIEQHGHVTRGELERNPKASNVREHKRSKGVYYTPSDVAKFMVESISSNITGFEKWLDPACGTGVFLREILHINAPSTNLSYLNFIKKHIFGFDISTLSTESCAFVLLIESAHQQSLNGYSPFLEWLKLKSNIIPCNALRIAAISDSTNPLSLEYHLSSPTSNNKKISSTGIISEDDRLKRVTKHIEDGFDRLVMNPPYSNQQMNPTYQKWYSYANLNNDCKINISLAFVEMMSKLVKDSGMSAGVLPLSIGASTLKQYRNCRDFMANTTGFWEFLFYDREPHSLFGEDIKTRNAIVFHDKTEYSNFINTSSLLKWTSAIRNKAFSKKRLVPISKSHLIDYIPKIGSTAELELYNAIERKQEQNTYDIKPLSTHSTQLSKIKGTSTNYSFHISNTAYNFINCFFNLPKHKDPKAPLSQSPLILLNFTSEEYAYIGFSLLSSRLAYWLWRIKSDGFHVTQSFVKNLSLWHLPFSKNQLEELCGVGKKLRVMSLEKAVPSINSGKLTYSFHTSFTNPEQQKTERIILSALGFNQNIISHLDRFIEEVVSIDGKNRRLRS